MIRTLSFLIICCVHSFGATWYVRPNGAGSADGTSYANAWNGINSVVFGAGGVSTGDTLYICGTNILTYTAGGPNVTSGLLRVNQGGITIRGDYPGDGALIFGGCVDNYNTYTWTGPDANGVYASQVKGTGNSSWAIQFEITNNYPYRLRRATNSTWVGGLGQCYFVESSSNYIKTISGGLPSSSTLALGGPLGWMLMITNGFHNITFQSLHFVGGGLGLTYPDSNFFGSTNITFTNCIFTDGVCSLAGSYLRVRAGNDYWKVLNCEIARTGEGIEADLQGMARGAWGWTVSNCWIHDINTPEYPTGGDPHAVGVQGGSSWTVVGNTISNTGPAIDFWAGLHTAQTNNVIARNYITSCYTTNSGDSGSGIVIEGTAGQDAGIASNVWIYGNVILNTGLGATADWQGAGITWAQPDFCNIYNNTIYNATEGIQLRQSSIPLAGNILNNLIVSPRTNCLYLQTGNTPTDLHLDYNLFWTNTYLATPFRFVAISGSPPANGAHTVVADPLFTPPDFRLPTGSPAIHAGTSVGPTTDYAGNPFANPPSIGAFEFSDTSQFITLGIGKAIFGP